MFGEPDGVAADLVADLSAEESVRVLSVDFSLERLAGVGIGDDDFELSHERTETPANKKHVESAI